MKHKSFKPDMPSIPTKIPAPHEQSHPSQLDTKLLVTLFKQGRYPQVVTLAQEMTKRFPLHGLSWKALGAAFCQMGLFSDALTPLTKAASLLNRDAETHSNLGIALMKLGQLIDAEASFRRALEINPDFADAHNNLGTALNEQGRLDEAIACHSQALEIKPNFADAHYNLGLAFSQRHQHSEAVDSYLKALDSKPNYAEAHNNLGNSLLALGRSEEAVVCFRKALEINPEFADASYNLGNSLLSLERLDEAESSFRHALRINPNLVEAYNNLGNTLLELGRQDEAETCYRQAVLIKPSFIEGRLSLARSRKVRIGDTNMAALIELDRSARDGVFDLSVNEKIFLCFALGKCHDDIGDYEKAFPYFIEGCNLMRATYDYDSEQTSQHFALIKRIFNQALCDKLCGGGVSSHLPIFVLGMPRSGTTLTEQIIASHPEVYGAGELHDLMSIVQRSNKSGTFPSNLLSLSKSQLFEWGVEYVERLQRRAPHARHITDKMPGNFLATGLIHLMLPNAKIIHVNRNPLDTCLSCFTQLFSNKQEHTYNLTELGRYYRDYALLMEHWRKLLPPGAFLDVQYEDIVTDLEGQARRIIEYCELEWDDGCLDFYKIRRTVQTASVSQVRQPIYKSSVQRWRVYEKFLEPLIVALGDLAPDR